MRDRVPGNRQLKEQGGFIVSEGLTFHSSGTWPYFMTFLATQSILSLNSRHPKFLSLKFLLYYQVFIIIYLFIIQKT